MSISTGMANDQEIAEMLQIVRQAGVKDIAVLHCISGYPSPIEEAHLRTIGDIESRFDVVAGLSDHTLTTLTSIVAVSLGASVIEKHITLSREDEGPDVAFSLTPDEFKTLCKQSHDAWAALGNVNYSLKPSEVPNKVYRRSVYAVRDIEPGEEFSSENIRIIRPGYGLEPKYLSELSERKAKNKIERGTALDWSMVEEN